MKVIVLCITATAAMTSGRSPGVVVTGYSPLRLAVQAANDAAIKAAPPAPAPVRAVT
jgi:hypothetical protein